jgi:hypothetical protein
MAQNFYNNFHDFSLLKMKEPVSAGVLFGSMFFNERSNHG